MAGFVVRQATAAQPLMPLRVFRSRDVTGANLIQMLMVAGMFGMFFLGALYLQRVLGYDAIEVGLAFLPVALGIAVMSLGFAARLIDALRRPADAAPGPRPGRRRRCSCSAARPSTPRYVTDLLPAMVLLGIGAGLAFPALMTLAMSAATPEDSGLASGLVNTTQQVGGALGLAVLATLSTTRRARCRAGGVARRRADRRLPPGVHDRRRTGAGGDRDRPRLPAADPGT